MTSASKDYEPSASELSAFYSSSRAGAEALRYPWLSDLRANFGKRDLNPILASPSNLIGSGGAFVFAAGRMMSVVKEGKTIMGS